MDGDAGGVNLHVAWVGEGCTFAMAYPCSAAVAVHGVGGEEIDVTVAAGGKHHGMCRIAFQLSSDEVADYDTACAFLSILVFQQHQFLHLATVVELYAAAFNLTAQCTVGTEEKLLTSLAACVECAAYLCTSEGTVVEQSAIVAGKRYSLCDTLVDNVTADLSETVDVGLAGAVVATLDGVAEETFHTVTVVLVVLGGVDATLGGDAVGTARRVLYAENVDVEAECTEGCSCGCSGEACADDDNVEFAFVGGVDQLLHGLISGPFLRKGTFWYFGV